jgi:predicted MFS family arabinose efflux permease
LAPINNPSQRDGVPDALFGNVRRQEIPVTATDAEPRATLRHAAVENGRFMLIALIAFLTLVDLFAAQAILPSLVQKFDVSRATMGVAVNASTLGMAVAGIGVAFFGKSLDRRNGIWISLTALALPTTLLAFTNDIAVFAFLRIAQGLCMATAFTLTMAYLAEHLTAGETTAALAAYVTGNVASNFFGRILSASLADMLGLQANFLTFAVLNLAGAVLVWATLRSTSTMTREPKEPSAMQACLGHLRDGQLRRVFAIGFLILFVFIGTYTYVNFQLVAPPLGLSPMALGFVYLVFLPSLLTTPLAGRVSRHLGPATGIGVTLGLAIIGLLASLSTNLAAVLTGLSLIAVGTFLAQAIATGHVGRVAAGDKASASGIYLSSYYWGGLAGSFVLGEVFDGAGWAPSVIVLIIALAAAIFLALPLKSPASNP